MPVKKNRFGFEQAYNELVASIAMELEMDAVTGLPDAPNIIEDYQPFSDTFSVKVVWNRWGDVPPADRVPIILEAYRRSRRAEDLPKMTSARGLTPHEHWAEKGLEEMGRNLAYAGRTAHL